MKKALITLLLATTSGVGFALGQININVNTQTASQGQVNGSSLLSLLALAQTIVSRLVPFAIGFAVLAFFFFLIKLIMKGDDPKGRDESMKGMAMSILALFLMVSIWGVIGFFGSIVGIGQGGNVPVPGVPIPQ